MQVIDLPPPPHIFYDTGRQRTKIEPSQEGIKLNDTYWDRHPLILRHHSAAFQSPFRSDLVSVERRRGSGSDSRSDSVSVDLGLVLFMSSITKIGTGD